MMRHWDVSKFRMHETIADLPVDHQPCTNTRADGDLDNAIAMLSRAEVCLS